MKKKIIVMIILAISFAFATFASARATSSLPKLQNRSRASSTVSSTVISNKCQLLAQKIEANIAKFNNNKTRHDKVFNGLETRVSSIIRSLDAKGVDTGNLKADEAVLSEKIDKFETDYTAYHDLLGSTKDFVCGQSSGQFVSKLAEARKFLPGVRKDILDIKTFYQTTIRPDIVALRDELKAKKASSTPVRRSSTTTIDFGNDSSTVIEQ